MTEQGTSICLLTYNRHSRLKTAVDLILDHCVDPYELLIVDDNSTNIEQIDMLASIEARNDPRIRVLRTPVNVGLSAGVNRGFEAAKYDTLIHIEDDIIFRYPGWNKVMRDYLQKHSEIGLVAPDHSYSRYIQRNGYKEVDWHLGMCWAVRKEIFDEIGGYDEKLLHQNECDYCLRVRMHGYRCAIPPEFVTGVCFHDDPGGKSEKTKQAEIIGIFQFRDKWAKYFLGQAYDGCSTPLYMWEDYPINRKFFHELALPLELNIERDQVQLGGSAWDVVKVIKSPGAIGEPAWRRGEYLRSKLDALEAYQNLTGEWLGDA